jgi:dipeptidyl aminopeptidase/acylaminoacyl peptidase
MSNSQATLTAEMIVDGLIPSEPQLAPDGKFVAFTVAPVGRRERERQSAIWLAATDGTTPPRRVTAGVVEDRLPRWSPDGAWLYFLSDRDERGKAQLHRLPIAGGEAEALTDWKGGVKEYAPLRDGRVALLAPDGASEEDERRERERDDAQVYGERWPRARLRLLDVTTREIRSVAGLDEEDVAIAAPSHAGGWLALVTWPTPELDDHSRPGTLWLVAPDGTGLHRVGPSPAGVRDLVWTADDERLVALASATPGGVSRSNSRTRSNTSSPSANSPYEATYGKACPTRASKAGAVLTKPAASMPTSPEPVSRVASA